MKRKLTNLILTISTLSFFVVPVLAECTKKDANGKIISVQVPSIWDPDCLGNTPSIGTILSNVLAFVPIAAGVVLFGILISGGVQVFNANANDDAKKKGFKTIQNALTGIVLLFISVAIITVIETLIGQRILFGFFVNR